MTTDARQAFSEVVERHRGIVFKVANTHAWECEDCADPAQESRPRRGARRRAMTPRPSHRRGGTASR
ncbi:MAG: hypothetical protein ACR2J7_05240 [Luteimonas sp.]